MLSSALFGRRSVASVSVTVTAGTNATSSLFASFSRSNAPPSKTRSASTCAGNLEKPRQAKRTRRRLHRRALTRNQKNERSIFSPRVGPLRASSLLSVSVTVDDCPLSSVYVIIFLKTLERDARRLALSASGVFPQSTRPFPDVRKNTATYSPAAPLRLSSIRFFDTGSLNETNAPTATSRRRERAAVSNDAPQETILYCAFSVLRAL